VAGAASEVTTLRRDKFEYYIKIARRKVGVDIFKPAELHKSHNPWDVFCFLTKITVQALFLTMRFVVRFDVKMVIVIQLCSARRNCYTSCSVQAYAAF